MNHPPDYADYAVIHPARWQRWWVVLPVLLFLSSMTTILLWPEGKPTRTPLFWFWSVVLAAGRRITRVGLAPGHGQP